MAQELEDKFKRDDDRGEEHALGMEENVQGVNNTAGDGDIQGQARRTVAEGNIHGDTQGPPRRVVTDGNVQGDIKGLARRVVTDGNVCAAAVRADTNCKGWPMVSEEEPSHMLTFPQTWSLGG